MSRFVVRSAAAQVASHLRSELLRGTWSGSMPGGDRLAAELGIGRDTVEAALGRLEEEGVLVNQGRRRRRRIVLPDGAARTRGIRVGILCQEAADRRVGYVAEVMHELAAAGHTVVQAPKCLNQLGVRVVERTARMVAAAEAEAWVVIAGPRDVLEWFAASGKPALALFGRRRGTNIAGVGPDKPPVMAEVTRRLVRLGHRRIVLLVRPMRRLPQPGASERAFLDALTAEGIPAGPYHLPDWPESAEGFHERLESLFRLTPPTALIVDEVVLFTAARQFLAARRLRVPEDVSLVCTDDDPSFGWCRPEISRIRWDSRPVVRRVVRWAGNVSRGRRDVQQTLTSAAFVEGGTIGPASG
jgi:DNA-binding LacI/PurR family transcriptional regulator/biotin operon repressor